MLDNNLIRVFLPIIQAGLVADGFSEVTVKQFNQPTQQGINTGPTVYFSKIGDKRYGFLQRKSVYNEITSKMVHTEIQQYETTFQVMSLVRQNPVTPDSYTASDLVNEIAAILQSDNTVNQLADLSIGILRIQAITNPYFNDDRDQFEASPSFDFVLTHKQTRVTEVPVIDLNELDIYRV